MCMYTHTSQTDNYIRTSVCSSFSQEGRICCQHTILLPVLSSPAYLCGMLLKMINCYFLICPLQDFFCLTAFNGPTRPEITNTHMQGCTRYQAKAIASGAVVGSPASDQAVRLDLARTPVPLSSTITSQEKKRPRMAFREKFKASGGNLVKYLDALFRCAFFFQNWTRLCQFFLQMQVLQCCHKIKYKLGRKVRFLIQLRLKKIQSNSKHVIMPRKLFSFSHYILGNTSIKIQQGIVTAFSYSTVCIQYMNAVQQVDCLLTLGKISFDLVDLILGLQFLWIWVFTVFVLACFLVFTFI